MRALLLAAGRGTRLRPLTDSVPKCLVEINGRPLLDYWIELLCGGGIVEILINLHHLPDKVRSYVERCRYPVRITTAYEETLLGTGGTLLENRDFFRGEPLVLVHADNLSYFDLRAFVRQYEQRERGIEITMLTFDTAEPEACGIVELNERGVVVAFHEKVLHVGAIRSSEYLPAICLTTSTASSAVHLLCLPEGFFLIRNSECRPPAQ